MSGFSWQSGAGLAHRVPPQHSLLLSQQGHCWPWPAVHTEHNPNPGAWPARRKGWAFLTHLGETQPSHEDAFWLYALDSKQALLNITFMKLLWAFQALLEENLKKPVASLFQHMYSFSRNRFKCSSNKKKKLDLTIKLKWRLFLLA